MDIFRSMLESWWVSIDRDLRIAWKRTSRAVFSARLIVSFSLKSNIRKPNAWGDLFNPRRWGCITWQVTSLCTYIDLGSPLDCKVIQPVHSEGHQPWDFFGRNDAKAETPVFWPPYVKSWLTGKDSDARRDWGQEEKWTTEDEMAGWHYWLNGRESE